MMQQLLLKYLLAVLVATSCVWQYETSKKKHYLPARTSITSNKRGHMTPEQIKQIRAAYEWNTKQLGEYLGVSGRTVEDWEQDRHKPRGAAKKILSALYAKIKFKEDEQHEQK